MSQMSPETPKQLCLWTDTVFAEKYANTWNIIFKVVFMFSKTSIMDTQTGGLYNDYVCCIDWVIKGLATVCTLSATPLSILSSVFCCSFSVLIMVSQQLFLYNPCISCICNIFSELSPLLQLQNHTHMASHLDRTVMITMQ